MNGKAHELRSIRITLLGSQRITVDGKRAESKLSSRAMLVVAILAVRAAEAMTRTELAYTLWPDLCEAEARATLRRQLYNIDRALANTGESVLSRDSKIVSWAEHLDVFVDVLEFMRTCEQRDALDEAAGLYGGDFAPYIDHDWAVGLRDRLRQQMCRVLDQLIVRCRLHDDERRSREYIERLLGVDPWREDVVRELMIQRYQAGDRAGALRFYRTFARNLRSEFDVEPMPETVSCFETISHGSRVTLAEGIV